MSEFGKNIGALDNGYFDHEGMLNPKGVDFLCAAIIRQTYTDFVNAYVTDAAIRWKEISYNCATYYEKLRTNKRRYRYDRIEQPKTMKEIQDYANEDIEEINKWFLKSEWFRLYSRDAHGAWFVKMAKKKTQSFVKDETPLFRVAPRSEKCDPKAMKRWEKKRDEWRKEHGLSPVRKETEDAKH